MRLTMVLIAALAVGCNAPQERQAPAAMAQATLPMADSAGNRMEALAQVEAEPRWCSADNAWCVEAPAGAAPQAINGERVVALPAEDGAETAVWPVIVRSANDESVLVGLATTAHQMYSGGGAEATHVSLYDVSSQTGGAARAVLTIPVSGSILIRACFNQDDEQARRGACLDEYKFESRVTIDESPPAGAPRIVLETAARTYPGPRRRTEDSAQDPPLDQNDLAWAADETCSYRRIFARGADGAYAPNEVLPECADYLEP